MKGSINADMQLIRQSVPFLDTLSGTYLIHFNYVIVYFFFFNMLF